MPELKDAKESRIYKERYLNDEGFREFISDEKFTYANWYVAVIYYASYNLIMAALVKTGHPLPPILKKGRYNYDELDVEPNLANTRLSGIVGDYKELLKIFRVSIYGSYSITAQNIEMADECYLRITEQALRYT